MVGIDFSLFMVVLCHRSRDGIAVGIDLSPPYSLVGIDFSLFMMVLCHRSRDSTAVSLRSSQCLGKSIGIDFSSLARGLLSLRSFTWSSISLTSRGTALSVLANHRGCLNELNG